MSPRRLVLTLHSLYCCRREGRRGEDGQATVEGARVRGWVKNTAGRCGFRVKTRAESAVGWDAHLGLGGGDPVHDEAALRVVDEAEVLVGLVDRNDVCGREGGWGLRSAIGSVSFSLRERCDGKAVRGTHP